MTFLKNFVNVLSIASISFILLSAVFAFIVYFNLMDGKLRSKGGIGFIVFGVICAIGGLFFLPLLYLAVAYFLIMWGLAKLGPRLWEPKVGKWLLIASLVGFALSFLDPNFKAIAAKPDNVPIGAMIFLLGIFTWIALRKAYLNDQAMLAGGIPYEKTESDEKLFTWPDLVYTEMLCMIGLTIVMIVWSIGLRAPLEEAANPTTSPNPAKAPWYFLGLHEMLVYFDPWLAGVVLPTLIIIGLMIIPFIDINPAGNGYYCFKERKYEVLTFFFGFHILWVSMIIIGTFFRGPGWNLFWPWQRWDPHKVVALTNVDLPYLLGFRDYWWSAACGAVVIGGYFVVSTAAFYLWVLRVKGKEFLERWGLVRFLITAMLFVTMLSLPAKMFLRLAFNVKYILVTPWFNI